MKIRKKILLTTFINILLISLVYISNITNIPESIILFNSEELSLRTIYGVSIDTSKIKEEKQRKVVSEETIQASTEVDEGNVINVGVNLFGIPIKEVSVNLIEDVEVVPLGGLIGMKLYTNGVLVVGMSEIYGQDNKLYKPYENTGIKEGDTIIKVEDQEIGTTEDLVECIKNSRGEEIKITYVHNEKVLETNIIPIETEKNNYKLGLWVRDTAAGVGTATFYEKDTGKIAMLGHGILDIDTEELIDVSTGEITKTNVISIVKGENGKTGRIQGAIEGQESIGKITKNTYFGIYGQANNVQALNIDMSKTMKIGLRDEIKIGEATLMCSLDNRKVKEYKVEIEKIYLNNNTNNKSMLIKVTDEELLEKTGGIIQGMSGSPIIQNGKLVGALTHVLVQNPEKGYAVFADIMVKQMKNGE